MKKYLRRIEFCARYNFSTWRFYELSRQGLLPIKCLSGVPVRPIEVDIEEFEKLISTEKIAASQAKSSLKTKDFESAVREAKPKKEALWPV